MFLQPPTFDSAGNLIFELESPPDALKSDFDGLLANYDICDILIDPTSKPTLLPKSARVCRFCGQRMPAVKFKSDAHTIPQLTGNRNLVSDFECDECNNRFSIYESHLSAFLGLSKTLTTLKGQNGIPGYKSPDKAFKVWWETSDRRIKMALDAGFKNAYWKIDKKNKEITIHAIKHPYIPLFVYKSLLKMGLCYIDPPDLPHFDKALRLLKDETHDQVFAGVDFLKVNFYFFPGSPIPAPMIICFERKSNPLIGHCPKYMFVIYFGNYIVQFHLPLYDPDEALFLAAKKVHIPTYPPLLGNIRFAKYGIPVRKVLNLSNPNMVYKEKQTLTMSYDQLYMPLRWRLKNLYFNLRYEISNWLSVKKPT